MIQTTINQLAITKMKTKKLLEKITKQIMSFSTPPVLLAICCIAVVSQFPSTLLAQENDPTGSSASAPQSENDGLEPDRDELQALKAIVEKAMSNDDMIHTLEPYVAEDFSIVTFTSRQFDDFEIFTREWNKSRKIFLQGGTFTVEIKPEPTVFDGNIAICRGDSTNVIVSGNGTRHEFSSPWTAVCRKENGKWLLVRAHSSIDPFSNPVLDANIRWYLWLVGALAAVGGIVLGFFSVLFFASNRKPNTSE